MLRYACIFAIFVAFGCVTSPADVWSQDAPMTVKQQRQAIMTKQSTSTFYTPYVAEALAAFQPEGLKERYEKALGIEFVQDQVQHFTNGTEDLKYHISNYDNLGIDVTYTETKSGSNVTSAGVGFYRIQNGYYCFDANEIYQQAKSLGWQQGDKDIWATGRALFLTKGGDSLVIALRGGFETGISTDSPDHVLYSGCADYLVIGGPT